MVVKSLSTERLQKSEIRIKQLMTKVKLTKVPRDSARHDVVSQVVCVLKFFKIEQMFLPGREEFNCGQSYWVSLREKGYS